MESRRGSPAEGLTSAPARLTARCAGTCYPADPAQARENFAAALKKVRPAKGRNGEIRRPIVPHIDFRVNLGLYAETYAQWRDAGWFPSRVIILGVGHRSRDEFSCLPAGFRTPLGEVDPDHALHTALAARCPFPLVRDAQAFQGEHSIEFVVVWLQILRDLFFPDRSFTILPVLCGGLQEFVERGVPPPDSDPASVFAKALADLPGANDPDTAWVASIDGCHVGPRFRHPFAADEKVRQLVASWEKHLWGVASSDTLSEFFQHLSSNSNGFYFDGVGVLHALLHGQRLRAKIQPTVHWHDPSDQSLVSFSRGHLKAVTSG